MHWSNKITWCNLGWLDAIFIPFEVDEDGLEADNDEEAGDVSVGTKIIKGWDMVTIHTNT